MYLGKRARRREGATLVEATFALTLTLVIVVSLIVGGLGVYRSQQVANLAREATRAASVRGGQYRQDKGLARGTTSDWSADVYNSGQARFPVPVDPLKSPIVDVNSLGLNSSHLRYTCSWSKDTAGNPDNFPYHLDDNRNAIANTVTVTVEYDWYPEGIFGKLFKNGFTTFSSTSQMQITN